MDDTRRQAGMAVRTEVLGEDYVGRAGESATAFTADFQDLLTRYAWGDVWSRPGLDRRSRSLVTVAMLATLGCDQELGLHVRGALRNGVSEEELAETLLQVAVYAGVPRANTAFAVAQSALADPDTATGSEG